MSKHSKVHGSPAARKRRWASPTLDDDIEWLDMPRLTDAEWLALAQAKDRFETEIVSCWGDGD